MELGEYSKADEFFIECIERTQAIDSDEQVFPSRVRGESQLVPFLLARGMLRIHEKKYDQAKNILDTAIGISKKVNNLRSIHNMENLRRYIDFEINGEPIEFKISTGLVSVYNYLLFQSYTHNNSEFFEGLDYLHQNSMYPSISMKRFIIAKVSRFVIQLRKDSDYTKCIEALEQTVVLAKENPILHAQQQQILGELYLDLGNHLTAIQHFEIARLFLPEEKSQFRMVLQVEVLLARHLSGEVIELKELEGIALNETTFTEHSMVMKASAGLCVIWHSLKKRDGLMKELDRLSLMIDRFPLTQDVVDRMDDIRLSVARKQIDEFTVNNALVHFEIEDVLPNLE